MMIEEKINKGIVQILTQRKDLIPFFVRKRSKFEGWLKFELASYLEKVLKFEKVDIETQSDSDKSRCDISFFENGIQYKVELKTPNANWKTIGVNSKGRPITKNIKSIINDTKKLNCKNGIVAFVLFPIPLESKKWKEYINRISDETKITLNETHYNLPELDFDNNKCRFLVCCFRSKEFLVGNESQQPTAVIV